MILIAQDEIVHLKSRSAILVRNDLNHQFRLACGIQMKSSLCLHGI